MRRVFGSGTGQKAAALEPEEGHPTRPDDAVGEQIDRRVIQMFALVEEAVAGATHALLAGDREAARTLVANDAALDAAYLELEALAQDRVVAGGLSLGETRWLLAVLAMVPELERSGDLAEHVAQRATRGLPSEIPARSRGYIEAMGELACRMWKLAGDAYAERLDGTSEIDALDDEMDDLHVEFIAEVVSVPVPVPAAVELALIGRFYERLGDHAVNLTRRAPGRGSRRAHPGSER
ncbi:MAG: phosphate signaling complex PhoU family protein [Acidimicrobiales bacterium]